MCQQFSIRVIKNFNWRFKFSYWLCLFLFFKVSGCENITWNAILRKKNWIFFLIRKMTFRETIFFYVFPFKRWFFNFVDLQFLFLKRCWQLKTTDILCKVVYSNMSFDVNKMYRKCSFLRRFMSRIKLFFFLELGNLKIRSQRLMQFLKSGVEFYFHLQKE